jgi:cellulose synthase/poly-beta-1,6-N-acetylglucosamine synthase-like glycosyltransferase
MPPHSSVISATVIIPTYTFERWELLSAAVASVEAQTRPPIQLILCVDHNPELFARCVETWGTKDSLTSLSIEIVANKFIQEETGSRRLGAGWARNSGAEIAAGDVLVFLDDDARANTDWLEYLLEPFNDPRTVAVGGAPLPLYETARPSWFPANFDWVFGCAYEGVPKQLAPLRHLIGTNMSVRRHVFEEIGGFHSIDFDDLDLCMRVAAQCPGQEILYEPRAIVHHFVPAQRVSWSYFWRRCYNVNREKVDAFAEMGEAANIRAEREFVLRALTAQLTNDVSDTLKGNWSGLSRAGAMFVGMTMAAAGHAVGRYQLHSRNLVSQFRNYLLQR